MLAAEGRVAIGRVIRMAVVVRVTAVVDGLVIQVVVTDGPVPEVPLVALFRVRLVITKPGVA